MFNTILVPLDGSDLAEQSLAPAGVLARRMGAEVILLRAPSREPAYAAAEDAYGLIYPEQTTGQVVADAKIYLKSRQTRLAAQGLHVHTQLARGEPAGAILDAAALAPASLIVMSSHGYTGLTRLLLGSVTEQVLRTAVCPVLVVRSAKPIQRMLVTLDGSELSARAVAPAMETALALGAEVTFLRVVPDIPAEQLRELDKLEAGLGPRLGLEMTDDALAYLRQVIAPFAGRGLQINHVVRSGPAAKTILEYAESHALDLIVMATHGRGGLQRLVYGSVTEKVLHQGSTSMLIVRPPAVGLN